jgi:hypothetical protein
VVGGGELPIEKLGVIDTWSTHDTSAVQATVRYWDCASSLSKDASWMSVFKWFGTI